MTKYRKKPLEVHAMQWTGKNYEEICEFVERKLEKDGTKLVIPTLEGDMKASVNDFIIKGLVNEIYAIKPNLFYKTYEKAIE